MSLNPLKTGDDRTAHVAKDREPRRSVNLKGFGLLDDQTTFALNVLDLTYDGCKVETELALLPGLKLKISILGSGGAVDAVVRWYKDGRAGLHFHSELNSEVERTPRNHQRVEVAATLTLRRMGRAPYRARLLDLTPGGCRVDFVERPRTGESLWVKFDGLDSIQARVRWVDGFEGGLEFMRGIYPAVFDLLIARLTVGQERHSAR